MAKIHYVDPAGNMTAIVRGEFDAEKRVELAKSIMQQEKAEQVGFETAPVNGGDCRLEMMGGEFCGNADVYKRQVLHTVPEVPFPL